MSDIHYEIFRLSLLRQINTVQISKLLLVNEVWFFENSWLAPKELLIGQHTTGYQRPPVVYAHCLHFPCHYHFKSMIQCRHSLQNLQSTIEEEYFIPSVENSTRKDIDPVVKKRRGILEEHQAHKSKKNRKRHDL